MLYNVVNYFTLAIVLMVIFYIAMLKLPDGSHYDYIRITIVAIIVEKSFSLLNLGKIGWTIPMDDQVSSSAIVSESTIHGQPEKMPMPIM